MARKTIKIVNTGTKDDPYLEVATHNAVVTATEREEERYGHGTGAQSATYAWRKIKTIQTEVAGAKKEGPCYDAFVAATGIRLKPGEHVNVTFGEKKAAKIKK